MTAASSAHTAGPGPFHAPVSTTGFWEGAHSGERPRFMEPAPEVDPAAVPDPQTDPCACIFWCTGSPGQVWRSGISCLGHEASGVCSCYLPSRLPCAWTRSLQPPHPPRSSDGDRISRRGSPIGRGSATAHGLLATSSTLPWTVFCPFPCRLIFSLRH